MSQDLNKYVRTPMTNTELRTYMNNELAKIQLATDTFFKMLGDLNMLSGSLEGDFLPKIQGITTAGTVTYTIQYGRFLKIGRLVVVCGRVDWTGHTGTGQMQLTNMPFAPDPNLRSALMLDVIGAAIPTTTILFATGAGNSFDFDTPGHTAAVNVVAAGQLSFMGAYFAAS